MAVSKERDPQATQAALARWLEGQTGAGSVEVGEVCWLPREDQLRDLIGDHFLSLDRAGGDYVVSLSGPERAHHTSPQPTAAEAYGIALLYVRERAAPAADPGAPS